MRTTSRTMYIQVIDKKYVYERINGKNKICCVIYYKTFTNGYEETGTAWIGDYCYLAGSIKEGEIYRMTILNGCVLDFRPAKMRNEDNNELK